MADKMLIDATHPEETRVVVLRGNRVEEFDFESAHRKQLRGNIYLAKVTRVEPSLQAAFVDYGGNRHGFLAFSEIHPDYYQIPVADRQALIAEEARAQHEADEDADIRGRRHRHRAQAATRGEASARSEPIADEPLGPDTSERSEEPSEFREEDKEKEEAAAAAPAVVPSPESLAPPAAGESSPSAADAAEEPAMLPPSPPAEVERTAAADGLDPQAEGERAGEEAGPIQDAESAESTAQASAAEGDSEPAAADGNDAGEETVEEDVVESVGGADALEEAQERIPRLRRQYKIQEVIKRRQVMLVQVVKEERGTKGAALTTYLSLAGRYSVLMPNTARGGGISRKITNPEDRARLKEIAAELDVPEGMGVILRTAGASRTKSEVKRDFEYLLRLWEQIRDLTLKSTAPTLVYEEGSLTKRAIRDLYTKDIDEVIVAGEAGYRDAREMMRMLMPSHVKNVKLYKDQQPIFSRYGIENQLDAMFSPVVQLKSGGYIVINQAEALVAIDVNSGRATREHHIEDTALKTNLEAAEEIARQLRLRDLAGLIVIDFIDMDEPRNNRMVERRLKEALKQDRARIQVGRISHFGLLEMSRQRIRSSVLESSTEKCPLCGGSGHVRSVSSVALQALRALEEMLLKGATHNLIVRTRTEVALYMLNHKRAHLRQLEERFRVTITVSVDPTISGQQSFVIDRGEHVHALETARAHAPSTPVALAPAEPSEAEETDASPGVSGSRAMPAEDAQGEPHGRRRRRRGRDRGQDARPPAAQTSPGEDAVAPARDGNEAGVVEGAIDGEQAETPAPREALAAENGGERQGRRRRRRGRRGGRRNRRRNGDFQRESDGQVASEPGVEPAPAVFDAAGAAQAPVFSPPPPHADLHADPHPAAPPSRSDVASPGEAAPAESQPPRRRSTVREPAPFAGGIDSPPPVSPPPMPVISVTSSEEPAQPKRGWWRRT
ncbi:MAG: Rne/Rng family ribonuclease [Pseudolabrys sp.]|nr:Rne/Rng family ribonuclease [Pseudolabrys sp.]